MADDYEVGSLIYHKEKGTYGRVQADGSVLPEPGITGEPLNPMTPKPTLGERIGTMAKQSVAPTLGGLGGAALGTVAAPFTLGVVNPITGAMAGSLGGEYFNQKTGISPPSMAALALSAGVPAIPAAARVAVTNIPGAEAGIQQLAVKLAQKLPLNYLAKPGAIAGLYQQAEQAGASIPRNLIQDVADETAKIFIDPVVQSGRIASIQKAVNLVRETAAIPPSATAMGPQSTLTLTELLPNLQRLGAMYGQAIQQAEKIGKSEVSVAAHAKLYNGILDALETAAAKGSGPGVDILNTAKEMFKRNLAGEELKALNFRAFSTSGGHPQMSGDMLLRQVSEGSPLLERLRNWLPASEIDDIISTYKSLAPLPRISAGSRQGIGDISFVQRAALGGAAGGVLGPILGQDIATSSLAGIVSAEVVNRVMMSPVGRSVVRQLASVKIGGNAMTFDQVINAALQLTRQDPGTAAEGVGVGARALISPFAGARPSLPMPRPGEVSGMRPPNPLAP